MISQVGKLRTSKGLVNFTTLFREYFLVNSVFRHLGANNLHMTFGLYTQRTCINYGFDIPLAKSRKCHVVQLGKILVCGNVNRLAFELVAVVGKNFCKKDQARS